LKTNFSQTIENIVLKRHKNHLSLSFFRVLTTIHAVAAAWPRGAVFTATVWSRSRDLDSTSTVVAHVVVPLDMALYNDYLCFVTSNKQQVQW